MLTPGQIAHFETFGFLFLRQAFSSQEMEKITLEAEKLWADHRHREVVGEDGISMDYFMEISPVLTELVDDDRIIQSVEQLLGPDFIWVGSEGNVTNRAYHNWHSDRKCWRKEEEKDISYCRIKIMLYLDPVTKNTGCLRIIPGSHRMPLHKELGAQTMGRDIDPDVRPFGLSGEDLPGFPLESESGDVVFFNHCLFHSIYGGWEGRRIIALKFAAKPTTDRHLDVLNNYTRIAFQPHQAFLNSDRPRIRGMVENLVELGAKF